ncbi:FKBP-type peptidyl-prolyl cis-trans isomerase [Tsuneonella mangrovi]|uniref:FKBP-type peptidyl-prolyl cis-trans isomerase n=1 Tax=Tsuneonella mangrovi TaxID=1982042 RepID=UPI000BA1C9BB|nr:FKBP-type peptidyl-prolyl cis-trans isomerase [Tsuneonella mangrovi]
MIDRSALLAVGAAAIAVFAFITLRAVELGHSAQDGAWTASQQAALTERAAQPGWQALPGGLLWKRVSGDGSGPHPTASDIVSVSYTASLTDGTVVDTSEGKPVTFPLAALVPAWQEAIPQMGVGDTIEIASPAALAYGPKGKGPVPGGATLLFTVELTGIGEK